MCASEVVLVPDGSVCAPAATGTISLGGIPAGSYIARAYLFWANINPADPGGAMMINGNGTTSHLDGQDVSPCWPAPGSSQTIFS